MAGRGRESEDRWDDDTFVVLVKRQLLSAFRLACLLRGTASDGQTAVHEAIRRAWTAWPHLEDLADFTMWFESHVLDACQARRPARPSVSLGVNALRTTGADPLGRALARDALGRRLQQLPRVQRVALVLRYAVGRSPEQLASELHAPPASVEAVLGAGLAELFRDSSERSQAPVPRSQREAELEGWFVRLPHLEMSPSVERELLRATTAAMRPGRAAGLPASGQPTRHAPRLATFVALGSLAVLLFVLVLGPRGNPVAMLSGSEATRAPGTPPRQSQPSDVPLATAVPVHSVAPWQSAGAVRRGGP